MLNAVDMLSYIFGNWIAVYPFATKYFGRRPALKKKYMPIEHQMDMEYNEREFTERANAVGSYADVVRFFHIILSAQYYPKKWCTNIT